MSEMMKNKELELTDELLEAISGGTYDDHEREMQEEMERRLEWNKQLMIADWADLSYEERLKFYEDPRFAEILKSLGLTLD